MNPQRLSLDDMRRLVGSLPKDLVAMLRTRQVYLAGGFVRAKIAGEPVNDIDLFAADATAAERQATALAAAREVVVHRTKNAFTVICPPRLPVQFIHRWAFTDPAALISSFDFTVAQACLWFDQGKSAWSSIAAPRFYRDLAAKRLVYTSPVRNEDAGGSILRVQKFLKRGYDISPEQLGMVLARLVGGVRDGSGFWQAGEREKAAVLVGLLRQADPLTVIDGLEPSDDSLEEPPTPPVFTAEDC